MIKATHKLAAQPRCPECNAPLTKPSDGPCLACQIRDQSPRARLQAAVKTRLAELRPSNSASLDSVACVPTSLLARITEPSSAPRYPDRTVRSADAGTRELVDRLVKLFYLADRWDVSLHEALELAEERFVELVDSSAPRLSNGVRQS